MFLSAPKAAVQRGEAVEPPLDLDRGPRARLHGKGGKWRTCPLWDETARLLRQVVGESPAAQTPVFSSSAGRPLTPLGIYKIVRRRARGLLRPEHLSGGTTRRCSPGWRPVETAS